AIDIRPPVAPRGGSTAPGRRRTQQPGDRRRARAERPHRRATPGDDVRQDRRQWQTGAGGRRRLRHRQWIGARPGVRGTPGGSAPAPSWRGCMRYGLLSRQYGAIALLACSVLFMVVLGAARAAEPSTSAPASAVVTQDASRSWENNPNWWMADNAEM